MLGDNALFNDTKNQDEIQEITEVKSNLSNAEILEAIPDAPAIIRSKIKEYKEQREKLVAEIDARTKTINEATDDEFSQWFWLKWLALNEGEELAQIDKHLVRLGRQLRLMMGVPKDSDITEGLIQAARQVPVESLVNQQFRRSGKNLIGHCPFHKEHTASFYIYRKQNRGWCFGCNKGGDAIDVAMLLHGTDFKQTVQLLAGGAR